MSEGEGKWYVVAKTSKPVVGAGGMKVKVFAELHHKDDPNRVFAELSGPTAEKSLSDYAAMRNKQNAPMPPLQTAKCAADEQELL